MLDIVVYGATGFVGRLAAKALAADPEVKLGIAGRDLAKLEALAQSLERPVTVLQADADDREALTRLVRQTRVIANFAGPFARYAPILIEICCQEGRAYCDITGESGFVREMIERHEETAKASGALLIPMAGFDSVPADLLAYQAHKEALARQKPWKKLTHYYKIRGGFNGGTLASALNAAELPTAHNPLSPNVLIPDRTWPRPPRASFAPRFDREIGRWTSLFFMHPVNTAVVRRSRYLEGNSGRLSAETLYEERMVLHGGVKGGVEAGAVTTALAGFAALSTQKFGRKILSRLGPAPGEGPSLKARQKGFYRGELHAVSSSGDKAVYSMEAQLDPGNELTVLSAVEIAKLLLKREPEGLSGFSTAAHAFAEDLTQALKENGVSFSN